MWKIGRLALFGVAGFSLLVALEARAAAASGGTSSDLQHAQALLAEVRHEVDRLAGVAHSQRGGRRLPERGGLAEASPRRMAASARGLYLQYRIELGKLERELRRLEAAIERAPEPVGQWPSLELWQLSGESRRLRDRIRRELRHIFDAGRDGRVVGPGGRTPAPSGRRLAAPLGRHGRGEIRTAPEGSAVVTGTVTEEGSGTLLAGIHLEIYDEAGNWIAHTVTNGSGIYEFTGLEAGSYYAATRHHDSSYINELYDGIYCPVFCDATQGTPIPVADGETVGNIDFALEVGGLISGTVTEAGTGSPIPLWVEIYDSAGDWASFGESDPATGSYTTTTGLPAGTYYAWAKTLGGDHVAELYDDIVCHGWGCDQTTGTPIPVTAGATTTGIDFVLEPAGHLVGSVTDDADESPIPDVLVRVFDATGEGISWGSSDATGDYALDWPLPAGTYTARTENSSGYFDELYDDLPCSSGCDPTTGTPIPVVAGATTENIDFALEQGGTIAGRLTDEATGAGIAEGGVSIYDAAGGWITDAYADGSGDYVTAIGLPAGSYFARTFNWAGYLDELYDDIPCPGWCDPTAGTPILVSAGAVTGGIDFALELGGTIAGTVTDAATGLPIPDVEVNLYDASGDWVTHGPTDASGNYSLGGLTAGDHYARTWNGSGYLDELYDDIPCPGGWCDETTGTPITVSAGAVTDNIDFALELGGTIAGRLTDGATGGGIADGGVEIFDAAGDWVTNAYADELGNYTTDDGLPAGSYHARTFNWASYFDELYDDIPCPDWCDVTAGTPILVSAGAVTGDIDFALEQGGSIAGRLTDEATSGGIADGGVAIYDAAGDWVTESYADGSGHYVSDIGLVAGTYYARTFNWAGYVDEVYDDLPCAGWCDPTTGTPITVVAGATTENVDFALEQGGSIAGRLTDEATGGGIADGGAAIYDAAGDWVTDAYADGSGSYATDTGLPAGAYYARSFNWAGYEDELYDDLPCPGGGCDPTTGTPITVVAGATTGNIDFALQRLGSIAGTVTDAATGLPIHNLTVVIYDASGDTVWWGEPEVDGTYTASGLDSGDYFAWAKTIGGAHISEVYDDVVCHYWTQCDVDDILAGTPIAVTAGTTTAGIDFALDPAGVLVGQFTDEATADPIADAGVEIYSATGDRVAWSWPSDATGWYMAEWPLPAGSYTLRSWNSSGYIEELYDDLPCAMYQCDPATGTPVAMVAGDETEAHFALQQGGTISGRVTDAATGDGILAMVYLFDASGNGLFGVYSFSGDYAIQTGLPTGTYHAVTYNWRGYLDELYDDFPCADFSCDPTTGTPILVTAGTATDNIDFALELGGWIEGTVTDAATGLPIAFLSVRVTDASGDPVAWGWTDASGDYDVDGLATGTYHANTWNSSGYVDELYDDIPCPGGACDPTIGTPIAVTAGAATGNVDFALELGGSIAGTVTDVATGLAIADVEVSISDASGNWVTDGWTDASGSYAVDGLPTGSYRANTWNESGYLDELYDDLPCAGGCDVTAGTPIAVTVGATSLGIDFALAGQVCDPPALDVSFPPSADPQSYVDGCYVQINGSTGPAAPGCYEVERVEWDWGDGTVEDSWFPASHTYAPNGLAATVTVTAWDTDGKSSIDTGTVDLSGCLPPGPPQDLDLSGQTVTTNQTFEACNSITASDFSVLSPAGNAILRAGAQITLGNGVEVEEDCELTAILEVPAGCP